MRRYREDGQRIVKLQGGTYVRRPQAASYAPDPWWYLVGQIVLETSILLVLIFGLPFLLWLVLA